MKSFTHNGNFWRSQRKNYGDTKSLKHLRNSTRRLRKNHGEMKSLKHLRNSTRRQRKNRSQICSDSNPEIASRIGYEYRYVFSMVDKYEISSKYKSYLKPEIKSFLFEIRTKFILRQRAEEGVTDEIIGSEKYDSRVYEDGDGMSLYFMVRERLSDYWMTKHEMRSLVHEAFAFGKKMAADPEHASLNLIPVVVDLDVSTVQQEDEPIGAVRDRAISPQNLVPLYLWSLATNVEQKPVRSELLDFLVDLAPVRVGDIDEGLALMKVCHSCDQNTKVGAQISSLPCSHAFHYHCIVRWLEDNNRCPTCNSPAYDLDSDIDNI